MGDERSIFEGSSVESLGRIAQIPDGENFIGRVVNISTKSIYGKGAPDSKENRLIVSHGFGIIGHQSVCESLQTGLKSIDAMIPVCSGQREVIVGYMETGKKAIGLDKVINKRGRDVICQYIASYTGDSYVMAAINEREDQAENASSRLGRGVWAVGGSEGGEGEGGGESEPRREAQVCKTPIL